MRSPAAVTRPLLLGGCLLVMLPPSLGSAEPVVPVSSPRAVAETGSGPLIAFKARYADAIQQAITSRWIRPASVEIGARCRLLVQQLPGGEVMSVEVSSPCAYDELGRASIKNAVLKAQPLPYAGFEPVFQRTLTLNFHAQDLDSAP